MMTEKERIAVINEDGERRTIVAWQHWVSFQPLCGEAERSKGLVDLLTDDGLDVNQNPDGTFTILQTDEVLTRI